MVTISFEAALVLALVDACSPGREDSTGRDARDCSRATTSSSCTRDRSRTLVAVAIPSRTPTVTGVSVMSSPISDLEPATMLDESSNSADSGLDSREWLPARRVRL